MEFRHRKLMVGAVNVTDSNSIPEVCISSCDKSNKSETFCPDICAEELHRSPPLSKVLIALIVVISAAFLFVFCYTVYVRYFGTNRRRLQPPEGNQETHDEDHGPVVDHHVWYINTIGLQPSIISSIAVCKYKGGEGLVEGTDCSVCLNEFQEDETLRILPKCSHAFHIPCIDTWLSSHTNCPMCRAPIVENAAEASSSSSSSLIANDDNSITGEDALGNRILEANEEPNTEMEDEAMENELVVENGRKRGEILDEEVGEELLPIRRSFSMDSLSALKITQNLANVHSMEINDNSDARMVKANKSDRGGFSQRIVGDLSLFRVMGASSSVRSCQDGSSLMQRSLSCYGKLLLPTTSSRNRNQNQSQNQNQNSILPA